MAFLKALQRLPVPNGHEEYVEALFRFKNESSLYSRTLRSLEGKEDPQSRYLRFEAKDRYSRESKIYHAIRKKYANEKALMLLGEKNVKAKELDATDIAKLAGIDVRVGAKETMSDIRMRAIRASIPDEEFERIKEETKKAIAQRKSTKDSFLEDNSSKNDPTLGDFDPI